MTDIKIPKIPEKTDKWKSILAIAVENRHQLREILTDEELRVRAQFFCLFIILAAVSLFMTAVNIITGWHLLMISTLVFGICSIVNIILMLTGKLPEAVARCALVPEMLGLFAFFIIQGEPEGFSALWAAMLPAFGMLLYRMKHGTVVSALGLGLIVFLLWTDYGQSLLRYPYTESFKLRFPFLYIAFFAMGIIFEIIRSITQQELSVTRDLYKYNYSHDALTGLSNRYGFNQILEEALSRRHPGRYAFALADIDLFKKVNDEFGHLSGDLLLKRVAEDFYAQVGINGDVCRWGGEEFAVIFRDCVDAEGICSRIAARRREEVFNAQGIPKTVTLSMGIVIIPAGAEVRPARLISLADDALYRSKNEGRNRITVCRYE